MNSETKNCQNCKHDFIIEPEDFEFYEKIKVPPPTFCPDCRLQRRFTVRNERNYYKRKCELCGVSVITSYSEDKPYKIYCRPCWWGDKWDSGEYGVDYDFSKPFFEQFKELSKRVPRANFFGSNNVNSDYSNYTYDSKNCYLCCSTLNSEDILYSKNITKSVSCVDSFNLEGSEFCYESMDVDKSYNSSCLIESKTCIDSQFLFNSSNCKSCFLSNNLRNKEYVFNNTQATKDEYEKRLKNENVGSYRSILYLKTKFQELIKNSLHKYSNIIKSFNSTGNSILNSKNAKNCFYIFNVEDSKYCLRGYDFKDVYDTMHIANAEIVYESNNVGLGGSELKFCTAGTINVSKLNYCDSCHSSSNLFGCIGLRNKQYCILNKQYTKEEYEKLVPQIIKHMDEMPYIDKKGRIYKYGEFFPIEISPFAYNETVAQEYFPLTKELALEQGYNWKDSEKKQVAITLKNDQISDNIKDIDESILQQVIECEHKGTCNEQCTIAFKITATELNLYKKMDLPLPRLCPNCRHYQRVKQLNPLKLWKRKCQCNGLTSLLNNQSTNSPINQYTNTVTHTHGENPCPNEFETTYSPDRPEIVYCEQCYQNEVV